ncbi:MAG: glycosyltransferase, partial [Deinococcus sp.]|nr:glycosyltransferase [Deinococcus sp.]
MSGSDVSVSVVIPTWRGAEHISLLLQSLWRQTLCPAEVIVIDSSSTDDTASIAAEAGCTVEVIPKAAFD